MKKQYIQPSAETLRLSSDTALLNALGASGDIRTNTIEIPQDQNRAPKRTPVF